MNVGVNHSGFLLSEFVMDGVGSSTQRLQAEGAAQRLAEALRRVLGTLRSSCILKCL